MTVEAPRKTLAAEAVFEGVGLHSGSPVTCRVFPGEDGIAFSFEGQRVEAVAEGITGTFQRTQLGPIHTIEHLMCALAMLGVTDAEIELTAPEVPGLDGSAAQFCEGLLAAGLTDLGMQEFPRIFTRIYHVEEGLKIAIGAGEGHFKYVFDSGDRWPGVQEAEVWLSDPESAVREIAPARTMVFENEIESAKAAGLGKGLTQESCLVIGEHGYPFGARFKNEPARHKLLDLIGDLSLSRYPLTRLNVVAERSGHRSNVEAAKKIRHALGVG